MACCASSLSCASLLCGMLTRVPAKLSSYANRTRRTSGRRAPLSPGAPGTSGDRNRRRHRHRARDRQAARIARRARSPSAAGIAQHLEEGSAELRRAGHRSARLSGGRAKARPGRRDGAPRRPSFRSHRHSREQRRRQLHRRAEDLSPNGWNAVIGIVLNGSFYCSRAVGRHMIERGKGGVDRLGAGQLRVDGERRHDPFRRREGRRACR